MRSFGARTTISAPRGVARQGGTQPVQLTAAGRHDLQGLLRQPTAALARLSHYVRDGTLVNRRMSEDDFGDACCRSSSRRPRRWTSVQGRCESRLRRHPPGHRERIASSVLVTSCPGSRGPQESFLRGRSTTSPHCRAPRWRRERVEAANTARTRCHRYRRSWPRMHPRRWGVPAVPVCTSAPGGRDRCVHAVAEHGLPTAVVSCTPPGQGPPFTWGLPKLASARTYQPVRREPERRRRRSRGTCIPLVVIQPAGPA